MSEIIYQFLENTAEERWRVIFEQAETPGYKIGLYRPEFRRTEEIDWLEQHEGPEIFLLLQGEVTLVLRNSQSDPASEELLPLEISKPVAVFGFHNAFADEDGLCYVVEATGMATRFSQRNPDSSL